jgi:hypothetical protein
MKRILPSWQQRAGHDDEVVQTFDETLERLANGALIAGSRSGQL